jgi:hypothetical protein
MDSNEVNKFTAGADIYRFTFTPNAFIVEME